jgi:hypothetical protein
MDIIGPLNAMQAARQVCFFVPGENQHGDHALAVFPSP